MSKTFLCSVYHHVYKLGAYIHGDNELHIFHFYRLSVLRWSVLYRSL